MAWMQQHYDVTANPLEREADAPDAGEAGGGPGPRGQGARVGLRSGRPRGHADWRAAGEATSRHACPRAES